MNNSKFISALLTILMLTGCKALEAGNPVISTATPPVLKDISFTTVDVYVDGYNANPLPEYVGTPVVPQPPGGEQALDFVSPGDLALYLLNEPGLDFPNADLLNDVTRQAIQRIDFEHYVALVLIGSWENSGLARPLFIKRVMEDGGGARIEVEFWRWPSYGSALPAADRYPFHVIKVNRDQLPNRGEDLGVDLRTTEVYITPTPRPR